MPHHTFSCRLLITGMWWLLGTSLLWANASSSPYLSAQYVEQKASEKGHHLRFSEKIALKAAKKRLQKIIGKQSWKSVAMNGDSASPCGRIILRNGTAIEVELTDITPTEIKYRPCGQPDYPQFVLSKKEVLLATSADGQEKYRHQHADKALKANTIDTASPQSATASMVFAIAALASVFVLEAFGVAFLLAIFSTIFGLIALGKLKKKPHERGKKMAAVGLILSATIFLITIVLLGDY